MMIQREHNRVRLKQEVGAAVDKLKSVSGHAVGRKASNCLRSDKLR
jgi:hypothetical protein